MKNLKPGLALLSLSTLITLFAACTTPSDYGLFASPFNRQIIHIPGSTHPTWNPPKLTFTVSGTWRKLDDRNRSHLRREIAQSVQREAVAATRSSSRSRSTSPSSSSPASPSPKPAPSNSGSFPLDPDYASSSNNQRLRDLAAIRSRVALSIQNTEGVPTVVLGQMDKEKISATGIHPGTVQIQSDILALNTTTRQLNQAVKLSARGENTIIKHQGQNYYLLPNSSTISSP